ncbi:MAG: nitrilase-related carbon-nitrogen hydrolase [Gammaproteobacteria bacterium]|nr:MAG: nitrilase-related carbon-nitrogen hydrolase [Gammaproteobacteria bacterium]
MIGENTSEVRYLALALQTTTRSVAPIAGPENARTAISQNIARIDSQLGPSVDLLTQTHGLDVRLVVLPEYSLTGAPPAREFAEWRRKAALEIDGQEYRDLGAIASRYGIFLAGNAYEADGNFPDLYFQTSFVIAPSGEVVLRYRRLISLFSPSPYDVLDRYVALYGSDSLFPVLDSPIGRLSAIASEEILYPEIARCHVMRGAEILLHSTSEMGSPRSTAKDMAKRARAMENLAYVVSANASAVTGTTLPAGSTTGMAKVVDYNGHVMAEAGPGGDSIAAHAAIDLPALHHRRNQAGLTNVLVRQPFQAFADSYRTTLFHEARQLEQRGANDVEILRATQSLTIQRLADLGLI